MTFLQARHLVKQNYQGRTADVMLQLLDAVERGVDGEVASLQESVRRRAKAYNELSEEQAQPHGELVYTLTAPDGSVYSQSVAMDTERDARVAADVIRRLKAAPTPRLVELARVAAFKDHCIAWKRDETGHTYRTDHVYPRDSQLSFAECLHPDCVLVRAGDAVPPNNEK